MRRFPAELKEGVYRAILKPGKSAKGAGPSPENEPGERE
jgi:hypothetical protein